MKKEKKEEEEEEEEEEEGLYGGGGGLGCWRFCCPCLSVGMCVRVCVSGWFAWMDGSTDG